MNFFDRKTWPCHGSSSDRYHLIGYYFVDGNDHDVKFLTIDKLKKFRDKLNFHPFAFCPYCGSKIDNDILDDALNVRR